MENVSMKIENEYCLLVCIYHRNLENGEPVTSVELLDVSKVRVFNKPIVLNSFQDRKLFPFQSPSSDKSNV